MQFRRQKSQQIDVNLTPLIDVVFLLLIFFMVSTSFTKETHLSLDLPEAKGDQVEQQEEALEIVIDSKGQYILNDQNLVNNKPATLVSALHKLSGGNTNMLLTITADAKASHQSVVTAMDVAGQMGFVKLTLTTKKPVDD